MTEITIPYGDSQVKITIPAEKLLAVVSPNLVEPCADDIFEIRRALAAPVGIRRLRAEVKGASRVVLLADDMTRQTPVEVIIPELLDELNAGGVHDDQVTVLIALGTHRAMTESEIEDHFGPEVIRRVRVINNPWQDPNQMVDLGVTANGTPVSVSRIALEADYLVGVGSITPHHIPGFSGGAKIVQPGITGAATTGATHYFSTRTRRSYLGMAENPVRAEMETIAAQVGLKAIFNVVLEGSGRMVRAFYGHSIQAHRAGVEVSREVYGVALPGLADIVIAGSHPCDLEFWQAHKSLYPADMAVKAGGTIIVLTPCPEGISVMHSGMLDYTAYPAEEIERRIDQGDIQDVASGALALAWAKVRERANIYLVSGGISPQQARALGFDPFPSLDEAYQAALGYHGADARTTVLTHAPDILPLFD